MNEMIEFFGDPWPSPSCTEGIQAPTPIGDLCWHCGVDVRDGDQGTWTAHPTLDPKVPLGEVVIGFEPIHRECLISHSLGGFGHYQDHEYWCVKMHDPDGGLSVRESALALWNLLRTGLPV